MNVIKKINENKKIFYCFLFLFFAVMVLFNKLTLLTEDDYDYLFSWAGYYNEGIWVRIESVFDIFPSLYTHWFTSNGRLVAHFFVHLFLMLPSYVFDVVNAGVFIGLVVVIYRYVRSALKYNLFLLLCTAAALWYFIPAFGQTALWLDGSCNYLWANTFILWYLYPFFSIVRDEEKMKRTVGRVIYVILGFGAGAFLEVASFGCVMTAVLCLAAYKWLYKKKIPVWMILSVCSMAAGFLFMMSAPGEAKNKMAKGGFRTCVSNFVNVYDAYVDYALPLLVLFVVVLVVIVMSGRFDRKMWNAVICFLASLATNFINSAASYYPERNMMPSIMFLIVANGFLLKELWSEKEAVWIICTGWVLLGIAGRSFAVGGYDIYCTYEQQVMREQLAAEQIVQGKTELKLPVIKMKTKYSSYYGLNDLRTDTTVEWPNTSMSYYFGVDSIIGIE